MGRLELDVWLVLELFMEAKKKLLTSFEQGQVRTSFITI